MNTFMVVLAIGNDERHYYEEATDGEKAVKSAKKQWAKEFPDIDPYLVSVMRKNY